MRVASFIFGPCLLLSAVLLPSVANTPAKSHESRVAGRITALLPEDQVLREKQTLVAAKDMVLLWRDVVKTEKGGRVRIELSDGSVLNVGSEAQLRIRKADPQLQQRPSNSCMAVSLRARYELSNPLENSGCARQ